MRCHMRIISALMLAIVCLFAASACNADDSDDIVLLKNAATLDEQLAILDRIALDNADELESGEWFSSYSVEPASGLPENLIPENWEEASFTDVDSFPEEAKNRKIIIINEEGKLSGNFMVRLLPEMRARSLAEAEYLMVIDQVSSPSGKEYNIATTSYDRDYSAYLIRMDTGEAVRFWRKTSYARSSGKIGSLSGEFYSEKELWLMIRSSILGELSLAQDDGSILLFGISGKNCYLKGYEGEPVSIVIPDSVDGYPVTEISANCFYQCDTLQQVTFPEGLKKIPSKAFMMCDQLTSVTLPASLETIGESAFRQSRNLKEVVFPEGLQFISDYAFFACSSLRESVLPASLTFLGNRAFMHCVKLSKVVCPGDSLYIDEYAFWYTNTAVFFFSSGTSGYQNAELDRHAVICAPEGSDALSWGMEEGYETIACEKPDDIPELRMVEEDGFEYYIFREEAALTGYTGTGTDINVPDTVQGYPVTRINAYAIDSIDGLDTITIPESVRLVRMDAIHFNKTGKYKKDVYIRGADTVLENQAVKGSDREKVIHAPKGSPAEQYVIDWIDRGWYGMAYEAWDPEGNPD